MLNKSITSKTVMMIKKLSVDQYRCYVATKKTIEYE